MTLEDDVPTAAAVLLPGFRGITLPGWLADRLRDGLAGVCLFGENVESGTQLRALTDSIRAANPLALIAIDEEGGDVTRLHHKTGSPYPGNAILGRIDDTEFTEAIAAAVGRELRAAGCNLDFAPDVDVNSNPDNPVIGVRSFGASAERVARHSAAWVRGIQSAGVAASAKHFPGHGDTAVDSHLGLPVVDASLEVLRDGALEPFHAAIQAGTQTIMTSHILLPAIDPAAPATLSARILQELLRDELGFRGVIVSDALDMHGASGPIGIPEAAVRALAAGCDLLCIGTNNSAAQLDEIQAAVHDAVCDGRLPAARLGDAAARTAALAGSLAAVPLASDASAAPSFDLARTAAAFDVRPGLRIEPDRVFVALETAANIAVGESPWGPAAAGAAVVHLRAAPQVWPSGGQLIIVGKDNHRHDWVRALIDRVRITHPSAVIVDMGWPNDDRSYADIATFGASRHAGQALLAWLNAAVR